jgi:hypothetical protein
MVRRKALVLPRRLAPAALALAHRARGRQLARLHELADVPTLVSTTAFLRRKMGTWEMGERKCGVNVRLQKPIAAL